MTFQEIEALRRRGGLTVNELCRRACVWPSTYRRSLARTHAPHGRTLARLEAALGQRGRPKRPSSDNSELVLSAYRGWAAHFASLLRIDVGRALASDPGLRANASAEWRQAAQVRELAVYCVVTELNLGGAKVARAIGVTRAAVSLMLRRVEDARDDPTLSEMIEQAAALISGRAA
jgi:transcriptional regulator with XRE-family HTH domain